MMKRCLAALGVSSMGIMFLHQFVRALLSPMLATHRWLTFAGVSAVSYGLTLALERQALPALCCWDLRRTFCRSQPTSNGSLSWCGQF